MRIINFVAAAGLVALAAGSALAAEHQVQMLNQGPDGQPMQFDPAFLKIEPGDTVTFVPTDRGHNSEAIPELIPEGAEPWKGKIDEQISVTLSVEGLYGYRCLPHFALGMVGLIQVGDSTANIDAFQTATLPGKARERMDQLLAEAQGGGGAAAPQ